MRQQYPWNEWLIGGPTGSPGIAMTDEDGRRRIVLVRGEHYECSQSSMCQQIRSAARNLGLKVNVQDLDDRIMVVIRAADPERAAKHYASRDAARAMRDEDEDFRSRERNA
jgi:hypothetical protein